jgi:transcriptional regulator with XRE-family HTH domain
MTEFRTYLRQLRVARGMTQLDLAERVGLAHSVVSAWEQGRGLPTPAELNATMRVLGGDVRRALNLIEGVDADAPIVPSPPTPEGIAAVVLDGVAADHARAEQLLYKALKAVIGDAQPRGQRSWGRR